MLTPIGCWDFSWFWFAFAWLSLGFVGLVGLLG